MVEKLFPDPFIENQNLLKGLDKFTLNASIHNVPKWSDTL